MATCLLQPNAKIYLISRYNKDHKALYCNKVQALKRPPWGGAEGGGVSSVSSVSIAHGGSRSPGPGLESPGIWTASGEESAPTADASSIQQRWSGNRSRNGSDRSCSCSGRARVPTRTRSGTCSRHPFPIDFGNVIYARSPQTRSRTSACSWRSLR